MIATLITGFWLVSVQMAPYLLFGFLIAGILSVFVSPLWVERHLGGRGMRPVFKSVLLGVPLPLCSCGVIAVAASMRRHGASRAATTAFLLATPQTGVDSIFATWGLMGPLFGILRPLVALITGVIGGGIVALGVREEEGVAAPSATSCSSGCCEESVAPKWRRALGYGFLTLPRDIARALIIGILIAGAIGAFAPKDLLAPYLGGGIIAMLAMLALGIPLYVCSTASIPIAVGFMHLGASPGAALAFLIAGPATNAATISTVWQLLGRKTALLYLATVAVGALLTGVFFDGVLALGAWEGGMHGLHEAGERIAWWRHGAALFLWAVIFVALVPFKKKEAPPKHDALQLQIEGIRCSHCVESIKRSLLETPGVNSVSVEQESGLAILEGSDLDVTALIEVLGSLGYSASPTPDSTVPPL